MRRQLGFSLIEILVAALLMALGVAGVAVLLLGSVQATDGSAQLSAAARLAERMTAEIRITNDTTEEYFAPEPETEPPACLAPDHCTPAQFARYNLFEWKRDIAAALPDGRGMICRDSTPTDGTHKDPACDGGGDVVIKVFWRTPAESETGTGRLVRRVRI